MLLLFNLDVTLSVFSLYSIELVSFTPIAILFGVGALDVKLGLSNSFISLLSSGSSSISELSLVHKTMGISSITSF